MQLQNNILKRDNIDSYALVLKSSTHDHYYQLAYGWANDGHHLCIGQFSQINTKSSDLGKLLPNLIGNTRTPHYRFKGVAPLKELVSTREGSQMALIRNNPKVVFFNAKKEAVCLVDVTEDTFEEILRQHLSSWI